jgi:hypothetical protein
MPGHRQRIAGLVVAEPSSKSWHWFVAAAALVVVLLGANYKLTLGRVVPKWDADRFYAPFQLLVADHARAGQFLLWDPWVNAGSPDYADPQIPSFSPLAMALGFVTGGTELAFRVYWLVIWFLGGLGVVLLGRHLQAPPWACFVIALAFVFSGFYTGHAEHTSALYAISSLGFVIWRLDVALLRHTLRPAVEAGVVWGLSALGGYPGLVFLNACFALLWAAGRVWFPATTSPLCNPRWTPPMESITPRPTIRFAALAVTTLVFIGAVVLSPTYAAFFLEAPGYTDRSGALPRDVAVTSNALHPGTVATFASPYLSILKQYNPELWAYTDISTASVYLGPIVPVLAMLGLVARPRDRWRWWMFGVAVGFFLAAFGQSVPVRGWLYDLVPPTRYFRHSGFFRIYPMFVLVVLALLGTRDLALASPDSRSQLSKRFAVTAGVLSAASISGYYVVRLIVEDAGEHARSAELHLWIVWSATFTIGLALMWVPAATWMRLLRGLLITLAVGDGLLTVHFSQPTMWYEDGHLKESWNRLASERNPSVDLLSRGLQRDQLAPQWSNIDATPHNKNLPLKIPTLENYVGFNNRFHLDLVQRPLLSATATGSNRIWCASQVIAVPPSDAAYAAFVERSERLGKVVLVVHPRDQLMTGAFPTSDDAIAKIYELPAATPGAVSLKAYRPDQLRFDVTCPAKGWLLVTDRWSRGWQAAVNGRPTEVWGGNFVFRALAVEAGRSEVHFTYKPTGFPHLVILSWLVVFVSLACSLYPPFYGGGEPPSGRDLSEQRQIVTAVTR